MLMVCGILELLTKLQNCNLFLYVLRRQSFNLTHVAQVPHPDLPVGRPHDELFAGQRH